MANKLHVLSDKINLQRRERERERERERGLRKVKLSQRSCTCNVMGHWRYLLDNSNLKGKER